MPQTAGEVVPLVAALVELERKVYHSREVIEGEGGGSIPWLATDYEALLQRAQGDACLCPHLPAVAQTTACMNKLNECCLLVCWLAGLLPDIVYHLPQ